MERIKWLDGRFNEVEDTLHACYGIHSNGDVELLIAYDTQYPVITADEIQELAEILKRLKC